MVGRLERLRKGFQALDAGGILLTDELSQRYLTDYAFTDGYVLITEQSAFLLTDFRYYEEATAKVSGMTVVMPENYFIFINDVLEREGIRNLCFEDGSLSYRETERIRELLTVSLVPAGELLLSLRSVKEEGELDRIRRAQTIADQAFSHILKTLTPNMTEIEVALELEFFMRRNGAEGLSFETIAVSGSASALPHGKCRNKKLEQGFLTMDFGCKVDGYCSDMTRTVVLGKATSKMKNVYKTVLQAQMAALDFLEAGVSGAAADAVARGIIDKAGYAGCFGHGLGHGVGLYIHEMPRLSRLAKQTPLLAGSVVTVEPGIYLEGRFGCRIEDMGVLREGNFENFTHSSKELIELF